MIHFTVLIFNISINVLNRIKNNCSVSRARAFGKRAYCWEALSRINIYLMESCQEKTVHSAIIAGCPWFEKYSRDRKKRLYDVCTGAR